MTITEKVSYIKGLAEGMKLDDTTNEGRLFKAIIDVLDDIALTVSDLDDAMDGVCDELEAIDEELEQIETDFYDDDPCAGCDLLDDDDDDEAYYEVTCPTCGDSIYLDSEMLDEGSIKCPNCGEDLEFDLVIDEATDDEAAE